MTFQISFLCGTIWTKRTFKWFFPSVDPLVALVVSLINKIHPTIGTCVGAAASSGGFTVDVYLFPPPQICQAYLVHQKQLLINRIWMLWKFYYTWWLLFSFLPSNLSMSLLYMKLKQYLLICTIWTKVACKRLLSSVYPDMLPKISLVCKRFITNWTGVQA